jgi:hypothetical protein
MHVHERDPRSRRFNRGAMSGDIGDHLATERSTEVSQEHQQQRRIVMVGQGVAVLGAGVSKGVADRGHRLSSTPIGQRPIEDTGQFEYDVVWLFADS